MNLHGKEVANGGSNRSEAHRPNVSTLPEVWIHLDHPLGTSKELPRLQVADLGQAGEVVRRDGSVPSVRGTDEVVRLRPRERRKRCP